MTKSESELSTMSGQKFFILIAFAMGHFADAAFKLDERYSWNQLDFVFPSQAMKDVALASGTYIPTNALPVGVEHWGNKLFVTVPRWRDGKQRVISECVLICCFRW